MSEGLDDSDDLSPMRRGGAIGSMVVLLSAMMSIIVGVVVVFPTTGMSLERIYISLARRSIVRKFNQPISQTFS